MTITLPRVIADYFALDKTRDVQAIAPCFTPGEVVVDALSAAHFQASPDEITWSHVGSTNHIRERLQEIANFATGKG